MNITEILADLCRKNLNAQNNNQVAQILKVAPANFYNYLNNNNAGRRVITRMIERYVQAFIEKKGYSTNNSIREIDALLKEKYAIQTQQKRAEYLGLAAANLGNYIARNSYGRTVTKNALHSLSDGIERALLKGVINPIYEFKRIKPRKNGRSCVIYDEPEIQRSFQSQLHGKVGLYSFYDSSAKLLYIGKTRTNLFTEITQQLARKHSIWLENFAERSIHHYETAQYLSAYEIKNPALIDDLETLAIRLSYNDGTNIRAGSFSSPE